MNAVVDAILKTTSDAKFVRLVSKGASRDELNSASKGRADVDLMVCNEESDTSLPGHFSKVLESVVAIQVGGAIGTGALISPDGWILTADHLIEGAAEIWVRLRSGIQLPAVVHRTHVGSDVALIKVQGRDFPCVRPRREANDLDLGSEVFAINAALGEDRKPSISRGVVAGYPVEDGRRFLQTDASVNPGSSGGPLFSADGRVAGVTVGKVSGIGIEGIGFAVPVDDVLRNLEILPGVN